MNQHIHRCRARWVLPVDAPPLENGEVIVENGRIAAVQVAQGSCPSDGEDFGEAILLPGLVNVHTHLDYTLMRGLLEDIPFFPWIRELTARKMALTPEDWQASATWGAAEAIAGGITTIGDCTDSGAALTGAKRLGLGGIIYQEVFGIDNRQAVAEILAELRHKVAALETEASGTRLCIGVSPHAPYTVRPELMTALGDYAASENLPLCIHAAESAAEATLLRSGVGPIAQMFVRREIDWQPPRQSTVAYLDALGVLSPNTLLVHGVQVSAQDRSLMRDSGAAWAHCPKSNAKLGNGIAPLDILRDWQEHAENPYAAVRVGLGSDSVASNNTMDMFEEMRFAVLMQRASHRNIECLSAQEAVRMATLGGAEALGLQADIGSLTPGKRADLCVVGVSELHSIPAYNPYNALVYAARASDVLCTLTGGETQYDARRSIRLEERFPQYDLRPARLQLSMATEKMREWRPEAI